MSKAGGYGPWAPLETRAGEVLFAHAVLVVKGRQGLPTVNAAVEYLYLVADDLGVDSVDLAQLIVEASERRAATSRA